MDINFKLFKRSIIIRRRINLRRFGFGSGSCFNMFHLGKTSFYIQRQDSRRVGFQALTDDRGQEAISRKVGSRLGSVAVH